MFRKTRIGYSPDFEEMSRREFDAASKRILVKINPKREVIRSPLQLEKKMIRIMAENKDYRLLGALKRGFSQRAFERLAERDKFHLIWLGRIKPELSKIRGKRKKRKRRLRTRF